ncbi:MAG TPA: protein-L-isoaspartate(D-aspartate) O-methyltransferase, partial [Kofleriaceae bacterium]
VAEAPGDADAAKPPDPWAEARFEMVDRTVAARGVTDERVLAAMKITPRHEFVPPANRHQAYEDSPLPIGFDLTISQPYIIATMTEAVKVKAGDKVLEIGTGSGYQAAVLAMMGAKVYTIEIHPELGARTKKVLESLSFKDVAMKIGDGYFGWEDAAPFDAIMITCATPEIPPPLLAQLKVGGRLIAPIGDNFEQELTVITKTRDDVTRETLMGVRFGQMKGEIDKVR